MRKPPPFPPEDLQQGSASIKNEDLVFLVVRCALLLLITSVILVLSILVGCGPSTEDLEAVDYKPLSRDDWKVSTPAEQGLDPMLVAKMYYNAAEF
jgi:hypothetical protein